MNQRERGVNTAILTVIIVIATASAGALSLIHPVKAQKDNSSVSLSLEPDKIKVPFFGKESSDVILLKLRIENVSGLKTFSTDRNYDKKILEIVGSRMDPSFHKMVGGWTGGWNGGTFRDTFSGSHTIQIFSFEVKQTGTTTMELVNTELIDENGNVIPHTTSGTTIEVVPFDNWVNGEYAKLKEKFDRLNENFADLEGRYENLNFRYNSLIENYARLEGKYEDLSTKYESLNENYQDLLSTYHELLENYKSVLDNLDSVVKEGDDLKGEVHGLQKSLAEKRAKIENIEMELASLQNQLKEKKSEISQQSSEIESLNTRVLAWQIGTGIAALIATLVVIFYIFKLGRTEE